MKALYKKSELAFAISWIIAYCVLMSVGDNLSSTVGITNSVSLPVAAGLSIILLIFLKNNKLFSEYGLCKARATCSEMLFYIPLVLLLTVNLWYGISLKMSVIESVLYVLTMLFVGFLEEVIFRGLLFKAMAKDNLKAAVIVSSVTFGIGHIIQLFNGSGMDLFENFLQVLYAIAAGFMFVMIYCKTKSLVPCIVTHSLFNALSVFADESVMTTQNSIISCIFLVLVGSVYGLYIALMIKREKTQW